MNFTDRAALGITLSHRLSQFRGKDAIILCLQESSLLTCLAMASELRAWVYPLIYAPVYTPDHAHKLLGAFNQEGEFCALPADTDNDSETPGIASEIIEDEHAQAMKTIHAKEKSYDMKLSKHQLDGRDVILVADVILSPLPLVVAEQLLKGVSPKSLTAAAGNASPEAARLLRISAGHSEILDILSGTVSDDSHYFERADSYEPQQQYTITRKIAAYWQ